MLFKLFLLDMYVKHETIVKTWFKAICWVFGHDLRQYWRHKIWFDKGLKKFSEINLSEIVDIEYIEYLDESHCIRCGKDILL
ncbi:MAG: hypothetical protein ACUZ8I_10450 [Candidatus Scalindua sp.]